MLKIYENFNDKSHLPKIHSDDLSDHEVLSELKRLKEKLKNDVLILGHHYQQDDVLSFADITGDSLELSKKAAEIKDKNYIIFCGVHFMAETADILTQGTKNVILPDLKAGCSMADMANRREIDIAWKQLTNWTTDKIVPITYINCAASLKSFVGENNGSICTSSNAAKIITWALSQGEKLLFFPDQHLGRNTCYQLGIPLSEMVVYDPRKKDGGLTQNEVQKAKVILWYGYCSVHQGFQKSHVDHYRKVEPDRTIIVHPECNFEVTQGADLFGSTSFIINHIAKAKRGSKFAVGTEINLVNRLAEKFKDLDIKSLSPYQCLCTTMYRIRPRWLLDSLKNIESDTPQNIIKVNTIDRLNAEKALKIMLEIS